MSSNSQPSSSTASSPPSEQQLPKDFKVYNPSSRSQIVPAALPDDYFTPTAADLRALQATLSARTNALSNAPLQIRQAREADAKAKRDRWPETTIRIRFTDRTQLEKVFLSTSKIRAVYAFVRGCLREDVKPIKFILYQAPKRDLKVSDPKVRDLSLAELQLSPSSVLLLKFEDESLNHVNVPAPLDSWVLSRAEDLPPPPSTDVEMGPPKQHRLSPKATSSGTKSGEGKVPKWLKLGPKK